jgi:hypothetical protein
VQSQGPLGSSDGVQGTDRGIIFQLPYICPFGRHAALFFESAGELKLQGLVQYSTSGSGMKTDRRESDFGVVGPQLSMEWLFGDVELPSLTTYLAGIYLVVSHRFVGYMGALFATEFNCLMSSGWWGEDQRVDPGLAEDR